MAKYTDGAGREWQVNIPGFGTVERLRAEVGLDLNDVGKLGESFADIIIGNARLAVDALWLLIREQAAKAGVGKEAFLDSVADVDAVKTAILEATLDFFLPRRASILKEKLPAYMEAVNLVASWSEAAAIDSARDGLRNLAGASPASAESVPAT